MEQKAGLDGTNSTEMMPTLAQSLRQAVKDGYTRDFKITSKGLTTVIAAKFYAPDDVRITNFYRFEGWSSPDDSSILYLIETEDGEKGTLVDAYGVYAEARLSGFIREVTDIHKKEGANILF
jgi:hypothetical protein